MDEKVTGRIGHCYGLFEKCLVGITGAMGGIAIGLIGALCYSSSNGLGAETARLEDETRAQIIQERPDLLREDKEVIKRLVSLGLSRKIETLQESRERHSKPYNCSLYLALPGAVLGLVLAQRHNRKVKNKYRTYSIGMGEKTHTDGDESDYTEDILGNLDGIVPPFSYKGKLYSHREVGKILGKKRET